MAAPAPQQRMYLNNVILLVLIVTRDERTDHADVPLRLR